MTSEDKVYELLAHVKMDSLKKIEELSETMLGHMENWTWQWEEDSEAVARHIQREQPGYANFMCKRVQRVRQMCGLMEVWLAKAAAAGEVPPSGNGADDEDIKVGGTD